MSTRFLCKVFVFSNVHMFKVVSCCGVHFCWVGLVWNNLFNLAGVKGLYA
jgi:hypothetical protein